MSDTATQERHFEPDAVATEPFVSISVITPKPGKFDELLELQLAQHHRVRGKVAGLLGGRLFRSRDERNLILVTMFETAEAAQRFREDERFTDHMMKVQPLFESAVGGAYETAYQVGAL